MVQNIYGVTPTPLYEYHEAIVDTQTIVQGILTQSYEMEGMSKANVVLISSNSAVMAQLAITTVTLNYIQARLKKLTSAQTN